MTKPDINVTPLIDVLLVLLIIFMVVTPVKPSKFDARVPSEQKDVDAKVDPHPYTLIVSIAGDSSLSLNKDKLKASSASPNELIDSLKGIFAAREQNLVCLAGRREQLEDVAIDFFEALDPRMCFGSQFFCCHR